MSFALQSILESKRALRQRLAAQPIAEKMGMLDAMRERALALRGSTLGTSSIIREESIRYIETFRHAPGPGEHPRAF